MFVVNTHDKEVQISQSSSNLSVVVCYLFSIPDLIVFTPSRFILPNLIGIQPLLDRLIDMLAFVP